MVKDEEVHAQGHDKFKITLFYTISYNIKSLF